MLSEQEQDRFEAFEKTGPRKIGRADTNEGRHGGPIDCIQFQFAFWAAVLYSLTWLFLHVKRHTGWIWVPAVIATVLVCLIFLLVVTDLTRANRSRRLARNGRPAIGVVTESKLEPSKDMYRWFVTNYKFNAEDGVAYTGTYGKYSDEQQAGNEILIIYDPTQPGNNLPFREMRFDIVDELNAGVVRRPRPVRTVEEKAEVRKNVLALCISGLGFVIAAAWPWPIAFAAQQVALGHHRKTLLDNLVASCIGFCAAQLATGCVVRKIHQRHRSCANGLMFGSVAATISAAAWLYWKTCS